ncbi:MAG: YeeE/YedE family protein [Hyphomicrobiaceae bacterium]
MENFTPISALAGGLLIGVSAAFLLLVSGRLSGISGILQGLLPPFSKDTGLRAAYVAGLVGAPLLISAFAPNLVPAIEFRSSTWLLVAAGLLVGFGTRLGSGCTSGHGICGLPRLSGRSIVATLVFFSVAALVVFAMRFVSPI